MAGVVFEVDSLVNIDGRGRGKVVRRISSTAGDIYTILIDGIDFEVDLPAERLSLISESSDNGTDREKQTTQTAPTRFESVSEADITNFVNKQKNKNTEMKTLCNLKLLNEFMSRENETREIHEIPPPELCTLLCKFFVSVRKPDGSNYEPVTLRGFIGSFERQLREKNYGISLIHGIEFAKLKDVLQAKQKQLKSDGLGNQPKKADPISDDEIEQLWASDQLGSSTPESLINSLWFFNTVNFGLRGSDEHREMCWGDVKLCVDDSGHEFLEFQERQTKTRQGTNPRDVRPVKPKMWANVENPQKCPINIYKIYASHCPADYSKLSDPFYIATHTKQSTMRLGDQWFKRQPIGANKLNSIMKRMAQAAGLSGSKCLTNHSARKHLVQKLSENNVPPNQIVQISGHRNIQSVNNYSHISESQHKNISALLTSTGQRNPNVSYNQFNVSNNSSRNTGTHSSVCTFHGGLNNMFAGNIFGGTFNINVMPSNPPETVSQPPRKRNRLIIDSDSE